jgi:energy-dependent translational throttle protein EttA
VQNVGVTWEDDGRTLIKSLSFNLPPGAVVGVVGPNGVGKSTLMRVLSKEIAPTSGEVEIGPSVKLGHVEQSRFLPPEETVGEVISQGSTTIDVGTASIPIMAWLAKFNLSSMAKKRVKSLSGGERSRVHLARTLRDPCNVLILDEPTNDLDVDTLRSLEEALEEYNGCALIVSHDRYFLDRVCTHTISFEGEGDVVWYPGGWSAFEEYRKEHLPELHARAMARLDGATRAKQSTKLTG